MRLPGGSQGGWCQAAKRKHEAQREGVAGEAQLRRAGADGDVGVQHHHGGVPPGEAVPALVAERMERLELGLPAVRLDVVVAERREPGRLAHDRRVRAEDVAIEQPCRAQRVGVVAHREHEVRVPGFDHRADRCLVAGPAAEVADDREGEPGGAHRRGPERALGEHAGVRPDGVGVVDSRPEAGQPGDVVDAGAGIDARAVLQDHERVGRGRRAERDDGAALRHALGHGAAGQRDGGDGRGDHPGTSLARRLCTDERIPYFSGRRHRRGELLVSDPPGDKACRLRALLERLEETDVRRNRRATSVYARVLSRCCKSS